MMERPVTPFDVVFSTEDVELRKDPERGFWFAKYDDGHTEQYASLEDAVVGISNSVRPPKRHLQIVKNEEPGEQAT